MAKIFPFHSIVASDQAVHHDNDECEEGARMRRENRRDGTGGRPRCQRCEALDQILDTSSRSGDF